MRTEGYTQCKMQYIERNNMIGTAWIPSKHEPHKGKRLKVGDNKSNLEEVIVLEVGSSTDRPMHQYAENWHKNKRRTDI